MKISFLIPAHNEEKIIEKTLLHLSKLSYKNYEVLIGLDGCTDNTEKIVASFTKKYKNFKYFSLNLRQGKPAVINSLIRKAGGEIIIINDADWLFKVNQPQDITNLINIFKDSKIGGIAESFPVEWDQVKLKNANLTYKMVAYSTYFWLKFQKEKFAEKKDNFFQIKKPSLFLTNIFRKKLYKPNISLGDDFERTYDVINQGYKIVLLENEKMPRMLAIYDKIRFKDFFKQKIRTAMARQQLNKKEEKITLSNYYIPANLFIIKNSFKKSFFIGLLMLFWIIITAIGTLIAKFKKPLTQEGWALRAQR